MGEARARLAQRAGGQHPAVADAAGLVDHRDLEVSLQRVMLQSVVGDDHVAIRMRREQCPRRGDAVAADPDRHRVGGDEQGLVADFGGIVAGRQPRAAHGCDHHSRG